MKTLPQTTPDGFQPISDAPYSTPVEVRVGSMTFLARLLPDASEGENGSCDQWVAEIEGEHPPCWSGGSCWAMNEDEVESLQPTGWRFPSRTAELEAALKMIFDAMLVGADGAILDYGWDITRLNKARPHIRRLVGDQS